MVRLTVARELSVGQSKRPKYRQDRREILALLAMLGFAFVAPGTPNAHAEAIGAGKHLESMTHDVFTTLEDSSLSRAEKERELRQVFRQNFDVPAISRFVLGKYWRNTSEAQRRDFIDAFEEMNARKFLDMVGEFSEEMFSVGSVQQDASKPKLFLVNTKVSQPKGEPIAVVWRVRSTNDDYRVFDVLVEGLSMAITFRQEYGAVIKTNGVDGLITMMRTKHAEITAE